MTSLFFATPDYLFLKHHTRWNLKKAHEWISAGLFIAIDIAQEKQNWLTGRTELAHTKNRIRF